MLFASMKETGMVCEFSPEQARFYIAGLRVKLGLRPEDPLTLSDEDQLSIMTSQVEASEILHKACGERVFIISDSSPINSMLYMSPEFRDSSKVQDLVRRSLVLPTKSFYSKPIFSPYLEDPNRIHSLEQSRVIDRGIPTLLENYPGLNLAVVDGTMADRLYLVQQEIFFRK